MDAPIDNVFHAPDGREKCTTSPSADGVRSERGTMSMPSPVARSDANDFAYQSEESATQVT